LSPPKSTLTTSSIEPPTPLISLPAPAKPSEGMKPMLSGIAVTTIVKKRWWVVVLLSESVVV
jgi:hypothetical protein